MKKAYVRGAALVLGLVVGLGAAEARAGTISVSQITAVAEANSHLNGSTPEDISVRDDVYAAPWDASATAVDGVSSSTTDSAATADWIRFDGTGVAWDRNGSYALNVGYAHFTVSHDSTYSITGQHVLNGAPGADGDAYLQVYLVDLVDGSLFSNWQREWPTDSNIFDVGQTAGSQGNHLTGSLTGTLQAGHTYEFYTQSFINSRSVPTNATNLTGSSWVQMDVVQVVPLPAAVWLGGLGLAGVAFLRRRRRSRVHPADL